MSTFDTLRTKIRQLWEQCDLFEPTPVIPAWVHPDAVPKSKRRSRRTRKHPRRSKVTRTPRTHPSDRELVGQLTTAFQQYNDELFQGKLRPITIRVSRRMKNRLGHYMTASSGGHAPEIAISWRHIRRDAWDDVLHTLIHEMVHQWQHENGLPLDHGQHFRRKALEVGISARATRPRDGFDDIIVPEARGIAARSAIHSIAARRDS